MLYPAAKLTRIATIQGALALLLLVFKPIFWLGALIHVCAFAIEARAEEGLNPQGAGEENLPNPLSLIPASRTIPLRDEAPPRHLFPLLDSLERLKHTVHKIQPGDTLGRLFIRFGLDEMERRAWIRSVQKHFQARRLRSGREIHFFFTSSAKGKEHLKALEIDLDEDWVLAWEKGEKGIVFSKREKPYDVEIKTLGGVIENSLYGDGLRMGLNPTLLSQLADIFAWEVDFNRDIQRGDAFKVLYEERTRGGKRNKTLFRVLAAELIKSGQKYSAIYFEREKGKGGYYDLDGRPLARAFLRFPVEFSRISSYFSHSRFHPILKVDRPHYGVDFVAKRGTPVRAVGDGRVTYAGWRKGGYGRTVDIEHNSVYATRYAHLQGFGPAIKRGVTVKKGQIIGYVGSSGMTTGPHLHFELYKGQQYIDPLAYEFPPEDRIEPALQRVFENAKRLFLAELDATPHS